MSSRLKIFFLLSLEAMICVAMKGRSSFWQAGVQAMKKIASSCFAFFLGFQFPQWQRILLPIKSEFGAMDQSIHSKERSAAFTTVGMLVPQQCHFQTVGFPIFNTSQHKAGSWPLDSWTQKHIGEHHLPWLLPYNCIILCMWCRLHTFGQLSMMFSVPFHLITFHCAFLLTRLVSKPVATTSKPCTIRV